MTSGFFRCEFKPSWLSGVWVQVTGIFLPLGVVTTPLRSLRSRGRLRPLGQSLAAVRGSPALGRFPGSSHRIGNGDPGIGFPSFVTSTTCCPGSMGVNSTASEPSGALSNLAGSLLPLGAVMVPSRGFRSLGAGVPRLWRHGRPTSAGRKSSRNSGADWSSCAIMGMISSSSIG